MKAITLHQPWASLLAHRVKRYETRGWSTAYRGPMAIHAGNHWNMRTLLHCYEEPFFGELCSIGVKFPASLSSRRGGSVLYHLGLPFGAVVAVVDLVDVVPAEKMLSSLDPRERAFGDFTHGRYAFVYRNVRRLDRPVPCAGRQGLWSPSMDLIREIDRSLHQSATKV